MPSPYRKQKRHHFWKSVYSESNGINYTNLYQKKFDIDFSKHPLVATAGSCFAQNIRRHLILNDCNYLDTEPAPDLLETSIRKHFGYETFSARFGNIYTANHLLQLAKRAFDKLEGNDSIWNNNGRFFDAYRPTIEPEGFASEEELRHSRNSHLRAVRKLFLESDVFIFTLGLTEAWRSKIDGTTYPMCPGTAAGEFDQAKYCFHNFTSNEVLQDMEDFLELVRHHNPGIKVILTVSPVPLVATATSQHVIDATSYSKAKLRTAAGELFERHDCIDYFPSFEIFTSPASRGQFYESDCRSPSQDGVELAMGTFFAAHVVQEITPTDEKANNEQKKEAQTFLKQQEDICDEMLLEGELNE